MINKNSARHTAIFYTCGLCNLQCRYCGIHKSPILKEIDDLLDKSFQGDYYFERVKEYFPRKDMLTSFETWGGEPFLRMERIHNTLHKIINHYPYFSNGFSSTNFSFPGWEEKFLSLMNVFGQYPYRDFNYCLQLSIDGPEELNDIGRGKGTTKKCLNNFKKLIELLEKGSLPENVNLVFSLKPTLDTETLKKLDTKEKIIQYYNFLEENFILPVYNLSNAKISIAPGIPNMAVPSPTTKEDGRFFSQLVKNCLEIEKENAEKHFLKFYQIITPFSVGSKQEQITYKYGYNNCGTGHDSVGFLPNNLVSICHEGFTQIVEKYTEMAAKDTRDISSITFDRYLSEQAINLSGTDCDFCQHCYKMSLFNKDEGTARLITDTALIISLAMSDIIDKKYLDEKEALQAAIFVQSKTAFCIKENYNITGSYVLQPIGLFVLLLNGAKELIESYSKVEVKNV